MAQKKNYSRYFIILQEDEKGYSQASDKLCSGYVKLEMKNDKCRISYYVQNLKKEMAPYHMILVCSKKEIKKNIKIGEMNIDEYGRTDVSYEYPVNNIAGSGIAMDKISGAAIVKFLDSNIIPIMSGFSSTEIPDWTNFPLIQQENVETEETPRTTTDKKSIFDKYEESIENSKPKVEINQTESKDIQQNIPEQEQPEVDETRNNDIETSKAETKEEETKMEVPVEEADNKGDKEQDEITRQQESREQNEEVRVDDFDIKTNNISDNTRSDSGDFFDNLVDDFEEIVDVFNEIKRCKWYRIPVSNIKDLYDISNYNRYTVLYYPMIGYYPYIGEYKHFLVGLKYDKSDNIKYIVYGIPGMRNKKEQPFEGKSGFVTWVSLKPDEEDESMGYWLMFYDFRASTIMIPVK